MTQVLLVGCGNMGYAMLRGWKAADDSLTVEVVEPDDKLRERAEATGIVAHQNAAGIAAGATFDVIVFAVKPQVMPVVLPDYADFAKSAQAPLFISVAAGVQTSTISKALGAQSALVRCMPNTPAAIGAGMMVCHANGTVTEAQRALTQTLLQSSGTVAFVEDESLMDAVTAVSGSGPAYIFHFIEALIEAGQTAGLSEDLSKTLAIETVYGAALLARSSTEHPSELRKQVTSPGGTTKAALDVLMHEDSLVALIGKAVSAAKERSIEMGRTN